MARVNPIFTGIKSDEIITNEQASVKGVGIKTGILLLVAVLSAALSVTFRNVILYNVGVYYIFVFGALIAGIVGQLSYRSAKVWSFIYAICEGAMLGLVSFLFEEAIGGIILSAVMITATIFGVMLLLYSTNIIKVTGRFVKMMYALMITSLIISVVFLLMSLLAPTNPITVALLTNPALYIVICLLDLVYAAFMLTLDFEQIKAISANGFDKAYEWNAALGLMITVVWIYVEVLRIIALFTSNKD